MQFRPSKRVVWLVIPVVPVLLMSAAFWSGGDSGTRGSKPPKKPLLFQPLEWCDEGVSAVMSWEMNPWNYEYRTPFGSNFYALSQSDEPQDREKYHRLLKLGREWYVRILARYPDLVVTYRDLPDQQNGLLQWYRFAERHGETKKTHNFPSEFCRDVDVFFSNSKFHPWDPGAVRACLEANRAFLDEARAIALMPDRSSKMPVAERSTNYPSLAVECAKAFLLEARLHAEQGNTAAAFESLRAVKGISVHLSGGEAPGRWEADAGVSIRQSAAGYGLSSIIPSLPAGQPDVSAWVEALCPDLEQPADFARRIRGEWNTEMQGTFLANLADSSDPSTPIDAEFLAEEYTRYANSQVGEMRSLLLSELPGNPSIHDFQKSLGRRSRSIAATLGIHPSRDRRNSWEMSQMFVGRTRAAFALLKGESVPNDPIYGLPYRWNPATRELAFPDIPKYEKYSKPIVVPKW